MHFFSRFLTWWDFFYKDKSIFFTFMFRDETTIEQCDSKYFFMIFFLHKRDSFSPRLKKMSLLNHRINVNVIAKERKSEKSSSRRLRISQQQHDDVHKHNSQIHQRNFSWWLSKIFDDFLDAVTNELNVTFHSIFGCCISCYPLLNVIVAFIFLRKINKILLLPVRIDQWDFFLFNLKNIFLLHWLPSLSPSS